MSNHTAKILSVGTALPAQKVSQIDLRDFAHSMFAGAFKDIDRLVKIFLNSQIQTRNFCMPLSWFKEPKTFAEKNALYLEHAIALSETAARQAMSRAKVKPEEIGTIIFVSTTGLATPSLDAVLIKKLGLSLHTQRLPVWGLGCAGGAAGLARACEIAMAQPNKLVLLVAVELCSLTFQHNDKSKSNLVATSLFADGAAAVLVGAGEQYFGPRMLGSYSTLLPDSEDVMGWDVVETGLKVRFSRDVPTLVHNLMRENIEAAASHNNLKFSNLKHFVTHPGGVKVLAAYQEALGLKENQLEDSFEVLRDCGNMSSVSVLFVLEKFLARLQLPKNESGIISAMGPGFSAEHVFFST